MTSTIGVVSAAQNIPIKTTAIGYMSTVVTTIVIPVVTTIVIANLALAIYRKMQEGHLQGKNTTAIIPNVTFKDWIGQEKHKQELNRDFVVPYRHKKTLPSQPMGNSMVSRLKAYLQSSRDASSSSSNTRDLQNKVKPANGILLYGPPGCGKTHTAACLAGELGFKLLTISKSTYGSPFVNQASINLEKIFTAAFQEKNIVLFFDDADAIIGNRADNTESKMSTNNNDIGELLRWMDQCHQHNVIVIFATNYLGQLDPALMRDGRIDLTIHLKPPNAQERLSLLNHYFSTTNLKSIDCSQIATATEEFTPSELKNLVERSNREHAIEPSKARDYQSILETIYKIKKTKLKQWLVTQKLSEKEVCFLKAIIKEKWNKLKLQPLSSTHAVFRETIKNSREQQHPLYQIMQLLFAMFNQGNN